MARAKPFFYATMDVTSDSALLVVHQGIQSDNDGGYSNVGGVSQVIAGLTPGTPLFLLTEAGDFIVDSTIAGPRLLARHLNYQLNSSDRLNFQGSHLTVVGGNFSASIPGPIRDTVNRFIDCHQSEPSEEAICPDTISSDSLEILLPMNAIYDNIHGFSLQQIADAVDPQTFDDWVKNVFDLKIGSLVPRATFSLFVDGRQLCQPDPGQPCSWNPGRVPVAVRLLPATSASCEGLWGGTRTFGSGSRPARWASIDLADPCSAIVAGHATVESLFDPEPPAGYTPGPVDVCRHTMDENGRLVVWWPMGRGVCPTRAMVYRPNNTTFEGRQIESLWDISIMSF